ncbi:MAG: GNAT family N-acetyltransferase [Hyphomicrobium sp.]
MLLGPVAVDTDFAGQGFGKRLITEAMAAAKAGGVSLMLLVGDEPYYGRFGFHPVPPGQINLPGPVDARRPAGRRAGAGRPQRSTRARCRRPRLIGGFFIPCA